MGSIYGSVPKFNDVKDTLTTTGSAGNGADSLDNVSAIDIGTGPTDRNAQCVALKSLYINATIVMDANIDATISTTELSLAIAEVNWQMLIILDRQTNKAALTAALIWEDPTEFNSPLNLDNRKRIKVLKKVRGKIRPNDVSQATSHTAVNWLHARGRSATQRKIFMKFKKPMKIEYDTAAVTGLVGDIVDNAISVWFMAEFWDTPDLIAKVAIFCRTRFVSC